VYPAIQASWVEHDLLDCGLEHPFQARPLGFIDPYGKDAHELSNIITVHPVREAIQ
jgi:hypothetical protein